jgi:uncharacterized protein DUF4202
MGEEISSRFREAIARFDAANARDPNLESGRPAQLLYAERMTAWLGRLYPQAPESLQLAARSQHIQRWMIPRSEYPMTRQGYHQWRTALYSFHADAAEKILRDVGYDPTTIAAVRSLLKKEKLKTNPDMQALEDVICLVFLEYEFPDFASKHEREKVIGILRRTWVKMSPVGHAAAMKLALSPAAMELIQSALKPR